VAICSLATYLIKASYCLESGSNLIHFDNISLDQMFQLGLGAHLVHWNPIYKEQMPKL
jgi:predicted oxidoreductase (fatty acid repression mutant protein)